MGSSIASVGVDMVHYCVVFRYEQRIDLVETRISTRLRDQLGGAKNANEMFVIFSRFNALFIRPHIRGAIREFQTLLIQRVKEVRIETHLQSQ
jgi:dynein heavy chain 1